MIFVDIFIERFQNVMNVVNVKKFVQSNIFRKIDFVAQIFSQKNKNKKKSTKKFKTTIKFKATINFKKKNKKQKIKKKRLQQRTQK